MEKTSDLEETTTLDDGTVVQYYSNGREVYTYKDGTLITVYVELCVRARIASNTKFSNTGTQTGLVCRRILKDRSQQHFPVV